MAKKLCLKRYCESDGSLEAFLECKRIPLEKNPGLRPIKIGEVTRRTPGRSIMVNFRWNILENAGYLQLYTGKDAGF